MARNNGVRENVPRKGVCFVSTQRLVSAISVSSYEIVEDSLDAKINNDDEFGDSVSLGNNTDGLALPDSKVSSTQVSFL